MSRVDTTSFANLLMGGLRTGINLGESANQQAFQQQQFNANEQQRGFANSLALEGRDMQRMQIIQQAEERVAKREELENKRKATTELMRLAGDPNAQYNPSDPRFAKWLEAADRETQDRFYSAGNSRNYLDKRKAEVEARIAAGYKFSKRDADNYEKDGIFIEEQHLLPTAKSERQQQDDNDNNGYLTLMVDRFGLPQETAQKWLTKSAKFVSDRYNEFKGAAEAVAKQQAEQQAAAQEKQQSDAAMSQARTSGINAGVAPNRMDAVIDMKKAGITLPEGAFGSTESASAVRAALKERIGAAKTAWELAQKDLEPFAEAVGADPLTGDPTNSDVTGTGGVWNAITLGLGRIQDSKDKQLIATYQQKKKAADDARRNYEALNQQALNADVIAPQSQAGAADPRQRLAELKAQGVSRDEAIAIVEREQGTQSTPSNQPR